MIFSGMKILMMDSSIDNALNEWESDESFSSTEVESPITELNSSEIKNGKKATSESKHILYTERPSKGETFGKIILPAIDQEYPIIEGTDQKELAKGVGHFSDSVLPGESDNTVLAGHRDTVFRDLGKVTINDEIIIQTKFGEFKYKINKQLIVDKDDRTIIVPSEDAQLTLITCYPFNFIGPAPKRFILQGTLLESSLANAEQPNNSSEEPNF
jgi:sortase A